jgi:hypothetical protein
MVTFTKSVKFKGLKIFAQFVFEKYEWNVDMKNAQELYFICIPAEHIYNKESKVSYSH